jgi:hypothetical protein
MDKRRALRAVDPLGQIVSAERATALGVARRGRRDFGNLKLGLGRCDPRLGSHSLTVFESLAVIDPKKKG